MRKTGKPNTVAYRWAEDLLVKQARDLYGIETKYAHPESGAQSFVPPTTLDHEMLREPHGEGWTFSHPEPRRQLPFSFIYHVGDNPSAGTFASSSESSFVWSSVGKDLAPALNTSLSLLS